MLVWLFQRVGPLLESVESHTSGDSRVFLSARTALASVTAFLLALLLGPVAIGWLRSRFRERVASDSDRLNQLQAAKNDTPTMGGLFIVAAIVLSVLLWGDLGNAFVRLALVLSVGFALLGGIDDWIKLSTDRNGLKATTKFGVQVVLALGLAWGLHGVLAQHPRGLELIWPIGNRGVWLGGGFVGWAMLVLVGILLNLAQWWEKHLRQRKETPMFLSPASLPRTTALYRDLFPEKIQEVEARAKATCNGQQPTPEASL